MKSARLLQFACLVLFSLPACQSSEIKGVPQQNTDEQVKSALCQIENKNFDAGIATLRQVLAKDPGNIYAKRLLPGFRARKIKADDRSEENLAFVREAVVAYEKAAVDPDFTDKQEKINDFIILLYGVIGGDEKYSALLKKAENTSAPAKQRAIYYAALAGDKRDCANAISDADAVKTSVQRNKKWFNTFRRPQNQTDFDVLKGCATDGMSLIEKAISLDPKSGKAWIEQGYLYDQFARIAEMGGDEDAKVQFKQKYDAALRKTIDLNEKQRQAERAAAENLPASSTGKNLDQMPEEFTTELRTHRKEIPIDKIVDGLELPVELPALDKTGFQATIEKEKQREQVQREAKFKKADWHAYTAKSVFRATLPGQVKVEEIGSVRNYESTGDSLYFYVAESDSFELSEQEQDATLNILAWTLAKQIGNFHLMGKIPGSRFETELMRKDHFGGKAARFYSCKLITCQGATGGMMIFLIGNQKIYSIYIRGVSDESDPRFQKFWNSLKLG